MGVLRTVTLNSGYDDHFVVSRLEWGGVGRVEWFRSVPAGKGINAGRVAHQLGVPACVYSLVGRRDLPDFSARLSAEGLAHRLEPVESTTRHNLTLTQVEASTLAAHTVGDGYHLPDTSAADALVARLIAETGPDDVVTLNGALPAGLPPEIWRDAARDVAATGARVVVDVQFTALVRVLEAGRITAAKPNESELLDLPGVRPDMGPPDAVGAALRALANFDVEFPLVTLGARGVAHMADGVVRVSRCPVELPRKAVGAGDAFVAGLCAALLGAGPAGAAPMDLGLATAAAHVAGMEGEDLRRQVSINLGRVETTEGLGSLDG